MKIQEFGGDLVNARFRLLPIKDDAASKKAGRPIFNDLEVCDISFPGNKYSAPTFPAHEVFRWNEEATEYGLDRSPVTYAQHYQKEYLAFKSGDARASIGTPLEELPFLTQSKRLELKALKIYNAEALAALDGNSLKMVGPGGRELKDQAAAYIEAAVKVAGTSELMDQMRAQSEELAALKKQMAEMSLTPAAVAKTKKPSDFDTFEDGDILSWIRDADPATALTETSSRDDLIERADAILAVQGKAKQKGKSQ